MLATPNQRVDRCLRAGTVGKGPKEVESLAGRQLKPTVLAGETEAGDPARPIHVRLTPSAPARRSSRRSRLRSWAAPRTGRRGGMRPSTCSR